jgi:hypothetical protein
LSTGLPRRYDPVTVTSPINRRTFVSGLGAVLAAPLAAVAQQGGKVPRIGWLGGPSRESAEPFEWRFAGGRAERLPDLAAELVGLRVDLIVVPSTPTALAAKNATKTIPIVTGGLTQGERHILCGPRLLGVTGSRCHDGSWGAEEDAKTEDDERADQAPPGE